MAGSIKGITIEIEGKTSGLVKSLNDVNKSLKMTQDSLKTVNKALKLDPKNLDTLKTKQGLLNTAIDETKQKLEMEKQVAMDAAKALEEGTITKGQYDALQAEVAKTTAELKSLEEEAQRTNQTIGELGGNTSGLKSLGSAIQSAGNQMKELGTNVKAVGENVTDVGKKMLPVSAGVIGLGTAAVKTAADFDSAMSKVAAVSGATGKDLEALRDKAREMGSKTKFSASEAAEAMNYMAMAGWKTEDMLSGIEGVMNLAAASGEDLATTSDIVTDALTAFGLTAKDSGHFADILAAASSNANTNVSMMGETFKYCAPIAGALGFSAEDTAEAIGLMANAGIKSSQAGTALREIMNNLSKDISVCGSEIGEVTIATTNADGSMRGLSDILAECRTAFAGLTEAEKAQAAESLVGKNAMSGFLALMNAGEGDINKLSSAIADCDGKASNMADTMNNNLEGQLTILKSQLQELAISFGEMLMPTIREVVGVIQKFVDWLNSMDEGTRKVIITIGLVAAALGPVLIIVGQVISAVGSIIGVIGLVVGKVGGLIGIIGEAGGLSAVITGTVIPAIGGFISAAAPIVGVIAGVVAAVAAVIAIFQNWGAITEWLSGVWEGFKTFISDTWNGIKELASSIWSGITDTISNAVTSVGSFISSSWEGIKSNVSATWDSIKASASEKWNSITSSVSSTIESMKSGLSSKWESIKSTASSTWEAIKSGISDKASAIKTAAVNAIEGAKSGIKSVVSDAASWGSDMMSNLSSGISGAVSKVKNAVSNVAGVIRSFLHFTEPDVGPLADFHTYMPDMIDMMTKGMMSGVPKVETAATQLGTAVHDGVTDYSGQLGTINQSIKGMQLSTGDTTVYVQISDSQLQRAVAKVIKGDSLRSGGR